MHSLRRLIPLTVLAIVAFGYGVATAQDQTEDEAAANPDATDGADAPADSDGSDTAAGDPPPDDTPPADSTTSADDDGIDVDALRQEYLKLRDRLFRSRARAAAVASAMYSTRVTVHLDYGSGRFYSVGRATIRLDGANVFDDTTGAVTQNKAPRFEGYIAPGRHMVSIRLEATGKDDERFTSATESSFVVQAPAGKDIVIYAKAKDAGDIPYRWKKKQRGSYKLRLDVNVKTVKRGAKKDGSVRRASK